MRNRLTDRIAKTISITKELDVLAAEFEQIDPKIALALDQISDRLDRVDAGYATPTPEQKKFEEEHEMLKPYTKPQQLSDKSKQPMLIDFVNTVGSMISKIKDLKPNAAALVAKIKEDLGKLKVIGEQEAKEQVKVLSPAAPIRTPAPAFKD